MARAKVWVEANEGGEPLVEAVRERLTPSVIVSGSGMDPLSVDVRPFYSVTPMQPEPAGVHPVYTHPSGDKCIWLGTPGGAGYWFIPRDVGGEGEACELEHAGPEPCLHDPKSYYLGVEPGEMDPDELRTLSPQGFIDRIYLAPWVTTKPPVHAQWKHEPTGAVAVVCSPFDVPGEMTDELEDVTCADCLRTIVRIYARKR